MFQIHRRECAAPKCDRMFAGRRNRKFCSEACSRIADAARKREKRKAEGAHTPERRERQLAGLFDGGAREVARRDLERAGLFGAVVENYHESRQWEKRRRFRPSDELESPKRRPPKQRIRFIPPEGWEWARGNEATNDHYSGGSDDTRVYYREKRRAAFEKHRHETRTPTKPRLSRAEVEALELVNAALREEEQAPSHYGGHRYYGPRWVPARERNDNALKEAQSMFDSLIAKLETARDNAAAQTVLLDNCVTEARRQAEAHPDNKQVQHAVDRFIERALSMAA